MLFEWDADKNAANIARRGLSFEIAEDADWDDAIIVEDTRRAYGERRFFTVVPADGTLYAIVFTPRGAAMRIISLRRASRKERVRYASQAEPESD